MSSNPSTKKAAEEAVRLAKQLDDLVHPSLLDGSNHMHHHHPTVSAHQMLLDPGITVESPILSGNTSTSPQFGNHNHNNHNNGQSQHNNHNHHQHHAMDNNRLTPVVPNEHNNSHNHNAAAAAAGAAANFGVSPCISNAGSGYTHALKSPMVVQLVEQRNPYSQHARKTAAEMLLDPGLPPTPATTPQMRPMASPAASSSSSQQSSQHQKQHQQQHGFQQQQQQHVKPVLSAGRSSHKRQLSNFDDLHTTQGGPQVLSDLVETQPPYSQHYGKSAEALLLDPGQPESPVGYGNNSAGNHPQFSAHIALGGGSKSPNHRAVSDVEPYPAASCAGSGGSGLIPVYLLEQRNPYSQHSRKTAAEMLMDIPLPESPALYSSPEPPLRRNNSSPSSNSQSQPQQRNNSNDSSNGFGVHNKRVLAVDGSGHLQVPNSNQQQASPCLTGAAAALFYRRHQLPQQQQQNQQQNQQQQHHHTGSNNSADGSSVVTPLSPHLLPPSTMSYNKLE